MAGSGSEKRRRPISLKARFTEAEAALIREQAGRAGASVAELIRLAVLDEAPLRASRRPGLAHQDAAMILARLGVCASALRSLARVTRLEAQDRALIDAALRDLADMRAALFEALGRLP